MKKHVYVFAIVLIFACNNSDNKLRLEGSDIPEKHSIETNFESKTRIDVLDYTGLETYLNKNNDSTYVVNFWATWCKPCVKEMPYFEKLNSVYAENKVKIIFVSLDFPEKLERQVIPFLEKNNIRSEVVLLDDPDANNWIPRVSQTWSGAIPATIMYNKKERRFYERSFTYEELETEVKSIL